MTTAPLGWMRRACRMKQSTAGSQLSRGKRRKGLLKEGLGFCPGVIFKQNPREGGVASHTLLCPSCFICDAILLFSVFQFLFIFFNFYFFFVPGIKLS